MANTGHARARRLELLVWLVQLAKEDREQYRIIREAMWALYADNARKRSACSLVPSNLS